MEFKKLGTVPPSALLDTRLQAHWAAQIAASIGTNLVDPRPDWSHTAFSWSTELQALVGEPAGTDKLVSAGLRLDDFRLLVVDAQGGLVDSLELDGATLEDGFSWLTAAVEDYCGEKPKKELALSGLELPAHAVGEGRAFSFSDDGSFSELSNLFANAAQLLTAHRRRTRQASQIRCWPHHFDIDSIAQLDPDLDPEEARSVGVGLSPGDGYISAPYWYVSPWPKPDASLLPPLLGDGQWHTQGFTAAVLTADAMIEGDAETQRQRIDDFLTSAVAGSLSLIG